MRRHAAVATSASRQHARVPRASRGDDSRTPAKARGPESYFPSIEKTYGEPMSHWFGIVEKAGALKHMELVNVLKSEHKMGHGHANAVVAYARAAPKT